MCWRKIGILTASILVAACGGGGSKDLSGGGSTTPVPSGEPNPSGGPTTPPASNEVVLMIPGEILELDRRNATIPFEYALDLPPSFTADFYMELSGSAVIGEDFELDNYNVLSFAPGQQVAYLNMTLFESNKPRGGRTLNIKFSNDDGQEATQTFIISGDVRLNDTGITTFSDEFSYDSTASLASHPNQDADFGSDVVNVNDASAPYYKSPNELDLNSDYYLGEAGFRYVKLDAAGNELNAQATQWRCVKDEVTGMVWERKGGHNELYLATNEPPPAPGEEDNREFYWTAADLSNDNAVNFSYPWHDINDNTNGGKPGWILGDGKGGALPGLPLPAANSICAFDNIARDGDRYCSTNDYVEEANLKGTCGFTDWQVPTVEQFRSIFNYQNLANGSTDILDPTFFDCAGDSCLVDLEGHALYWTATTAAAGPGSALCFDITTARLQQCSKNEHNKVMIVRRDDKTLVDNNEPEPSSEPAPEPTTEPEA
ncbi:Lcl domain-containing protein [Motilimonas pumila]|uniref:DUF1566 domain-containing protein n=1 Tax=Motilimonas pumila TaxID=2303987 RepID=A0A418YI17_9GAMM|nr:DUF1566 domain-containing protein [Motilimonas pumila]RJG50013.1 DUF1566 domain-containing protein [Motilimonas pumila]